MTNNKKKILIVDDEVKIVEAIQAYLEHNQYETLCAYDGESALEVFDRENPDLVILDLMIPKISGEVVCERIRKKSRVPIIMLTAKVFEEERINGFVIGADDYVTKPFSPKELMARVDNILRRVSYEFEPLFSKMSWNNGDLVFDKRENEVKKNGVEVILTPNEIKILALLMSHPRQVFSRERIIEVAFGADFDGYDRTVDSHIKNLRSKIETDSANPVYIITVRGIGYKFVGDEYEK